MTEQKHIIKRQVFEIHLDNESKVPDMQDALSNLQKEVIQPMINELLDQLSPIGMIHKIDKLEVDLGRVAIEDFPEVLAEKFQESIIQSNYQLVESNIPNSNEEQINEVEMLAFYLKTGSLPWWSTIEGRKPIDRLFDQLTSSGPSPLFINVIEQVVRETRYLKRLVFTFSNQQIVAAMQSLTKVSLSSTLATLEELTAFVHDNSDSFDSKNKKLQVRNTWWMELASHLKVVNNEEDLARRTMQSVLLKLKYNPSTKPKSPKLSGSSKLFQWLSDDEKYYQIPEISKIETKLQKLLQEHPDNTILISFIRHLERFLENISFSVISRSDIKVILEGLQKLQIPKIEARISNTNGVDRAIALLTKTTRALLYELAQQQNYGNSEKGVIVKLQRNFEVTVEHFKGSTTDHLQSIYQVTNQLKALISEDRNHPRERQTDPKFELILKDFIYAINEANKVQKEFESPIKQDQFKLNHNALKSITQEKLIPLSKTIERLQRKMKQNYDHEDKIIERLYSEFDDTDSIEIANAGLVILWPFLSRLFENLEFIEQRKFLNRASQIKAASTLQFLADGELGEAFEGLFPLNKVMCGIDLEEPIEIVDLDEDERDICEGMLTAAINRGPLWKNLTLDGLRKSYLQRQGFLSVRDDMWLLRVKKETFDITVEKLPWPINSVKLPWMNSVLMIEWL